MRVRVRVRSRRSARLAAIDEGAPHEALGRVRQVSAPVDDARRLASQLEQARRELLGGRRRNYLANVARACEADLVEAVLEQRRRHGAVALGHGDAGGVHVLEHQPRDRVRGRARVRAWLGVRVRVRG